MGSEGGRLRKKMAAGAAAAAVVMAVLLAARTANDHESGDIKEFTAFFDVSENEINEGNEIMELIAQKIGARCREQWLVLVQAGSILILFQAVWLCMMRGLLFRSISIGIIVPILRI